MLLIDPFRILVANIPLTVLTSVVLLQEYDVATDNSKNPRERLARQKQNLRRRLGLDLYQIDFMKSFSQCVSRAICYLVTKHEDPANSMKLLMFSSLFT